MTNTNSDCVVGVLLLGSCVTFLWCMWTIQVQLPSPRFMEPSIGLCYASSHLCVLMLNLLQLPWWNSTQCLR